MSFSVLYWLVVLMTYLAGAGTMAVIWWFRQPHPGTRARDEAEAVRPAPVAAAEPEPEPAPPRTLRHSYDTMDVLEAGWAARDTSDALRGSIKVCGAAPGGINAPPDWRCVKPAGHLYLHETAAGGSWGDNTFEPPVPAPSWPADNDDSAGWVSGPAGGGNTGTWQPQP